MHVVAGAILDPTNRVLIAQRPAGKHLAGGWEFPGGKLEPGEERAAGLARELREELGIEVHHARPLIRLRHSYVDRDVFLDVWLVDRFAGTPRALDHQALRWCSRDELQHADLLAADRAVIAALRLPTVLESPSGENYRLFRFEDLGTSEGPSTFIGRQSLCGLCCHTSTQVAVAERVGADFVVVTAPLASEDLARLCDQANLPVFATGVDLETAWHCGATGISTCSSQLSPRMQNSN